ncbi:MAG TPA: hypothetical protein VN923_16335 [Thermoanaerobaculia bacterium]|nr:hypothetical protein [Thermoanaerobaculia bacterium]
MNAIALARPLSFRLPRPHGPALLLVTLLCTPLPCAAQMPADCPLHAAHTGSGGGDAEAAAAHRHAVDARGDVAMGFSQQATEHHFRIAEDGGAIEVTARDAADAATIAQVREHLQQISVAFAGGDFAIPTAVHAQLPPGAAAMGSAGDAVRYRYEELPAGGRVVITAATAETLAAVHEFLRFQIAEHGTGDPAHHAGE